MKPRLHKRGFLLALALAGSLALAEGMVRILGIGRNVFSLERGMIQLSADPDLRYTLIPGHRSRDGSVAINEHGYRDASRAIARTDDRPRIALLGDSIAFGMGAPDQAMIPGLQLERRLRDMGLPADVLSFGVPGYNIRQVAAMLETDVARFHPDLVLYLYCLNDPQTYSRELEAVFSGANSGARQRALARSLWQRTPGPHSRLWLLIRLYASRFLPDAEPSPRTGLSIRDDMQHLLDGRGRAFYHALYQDPAARRRLDEGLAGFARWRDATGIPVVLVLTPLFEDLDTYAYRDLHRMVTEAAAGAGLETVDLLPGFQEAAQTAPAPLNADPIHPNPAGYEVMARLLAETLFPRLGRRA